jgi:hypothetical protein
MLNRRLAALHPSGTDLVFWSKWFEPLTGEAHPVSVLRALRQVRTSPGPVLRGMALYSRSLDQCY